MKTTYQKGNMRIKTEIWKPVWLIRRNYQLFIKNKVLVYQEVVNQYGLMVFSCGAKVEKVITIAFENYKTKYRGIL